MNKNISGTTLEVFKDLCMIGLSMIFAVESYSSVLGSSENSGALTTGAAVRCTGDDFQGGVEIVQTSAASCSILSGAIKASSNLQEAELKVLSDAQFEDAEAGFIDLITVTGGFDSNGIATGTFELSIEGFVDDSNIEFGSETNFFITVWSPDDDAPACIFDTDDCGFFQGSYDYSEVWFDLFNGVLDTETFMAGSGQAMVLSADPASLAASLSVNWTATEASPSFYLAAYGMAFTQAAGLSDFFNTASARLDGPPGFSFTSSNGFAGSTGSETAQLQISLEEPIDGKVHGGIGNLRGWAVSSEPIDRVEIYIDGVFAFDAPYGGSRPDVADIFPDIPQSGQSGFSLAYGYSNLEAGLHTITAKAVTAEGTVAESTSTFTVVRFDDIFIGSEKNVDTSQAIVTAVNDEVLMNGVAIDGTSYNLRLKWRTAEQGFEIIEIQ